MSKENRKLGKNRFITQKRALKTQNPHFKKVSLRPADQDTFLLGEESYTPSQYQSHINNHNYTTIPPNMSQYPQYPTFNGSPYPVNNNNYPVYNVPPVVPYYPNNPNMGGFQNQQFFCPESIGFFDSSIESMKMKKNNMNSKDLKNNTHNSSVLSNNLKEANYNSFNLIGKVKSEISDSDSYNKRSNYDKKENKRRSFKNKFDCGLKKDDFTFRVDESESYSEKKDFSEKNNEKIENRIEENSDSEHNGKKYIDLNKNMSENANSNTRNNFIFDNTYQNSNIIPEKRGNSMLFNTNIEELSNYNNISLNNENITENNLFKDEVDDIRSVSLLEEELRTNKPTKQKENEINEKKMETLIYNEDGIKNIFETKFYEENIDNLESLIRSRNEIKKDLSKSKCSGLNMFDSDDLEYESGGKLNDDEYNESENEESGDYVEKNEFTFSSINKRDDHKKDNDEEKNSEILEDDVEEKKVKENDISQKNQNETKSEKFIQKENLADETNLRINKTFEKSWKKIEISCNAPFDVENCKNSKLYNHDISPQNNKTKEFNEKTEFLHKSMDENSNHTTKKIKYKCNNEKNNNTTTRKREDFKHLIKNYVKNKMELDNINHNMKTIKYILKIDTKKINSLEKFLHEMYEKIREKEMEKTEHINIIKEKLVNKDVSLVETLEKKVQKLDHKIKSKEVEFNNLRLKDAQPIETERFLREENERQKITIQIKEKIVEALMDEINDLKEIRNSLYNENPIVEAVNKTKIIIEDMRNEFEKIIEEKNNSLKYVRDENFLLAHRIQDLESAVEIMTNNIESIKQKSKKIQK